MKPPGKDTIQKNGKASKKIGILPKKTSCSALAKPNKISMGDILKKYQFRTTHLVMRHSKQQVLPTPSSLPSTILSEETPTALGQSESGSVRVKTEPCELGHPNKTEVNRLNTLLNSFLDGGDNNTVQALAPLCRLSQANDQHQDGNHFQSAAYQLQDQWKMLESTMEQVDKVDEILPPNIVPVVQNVVCTFLLGCQVDQKEIAKTGFNVVYEPKKFRAVRMAIRNPASTALIFANGKIICTGTKSPDMSKKAARRFARILMKLGYSEARVKEFRICNMVGTCDLNTRIDLGRLYQSKELKSPGQVGYNLEQFPGLTYPIPGTKLKLMIFHSGKINITGGRNQDEINNAIRSSYSDIMKYSMKSEDQPNIFEITQ